MINIDELIKNAMKSKNQSELRAYKNLKAEIQMLLTAKNAKPYDAAAEIQLISKMSKKLEDSILSFKEANREDLISEYSEELEIFKKLLPEPVNEEVICTELLNYISKFENNKFLSNFSSFRIPKNEIGNAIKFLKNKFPQANGKLISDIVKKYTI